MAPPASTFATLRALHLLIGDALDDIQRVFAQSTLPDSPSQCSSPLLVTSPDLSPTASSFPGTPPTSFPPTPLSATFPSLRSPLHTEAAIPCVDYPSPDSPHVSDSPGEQLALHPDAAAAASRIVAACGQLSNIVHKPFLSICDAIMGYNLPACMRLVEHMHIAEILREGDEYRLRLLAGEQGSTDPLSSTKSVPNVETSGPVSNPSTHDVVDVRPLTALGWIGSHTHKGSEGMHVADITDVICSYAGDGYVDSNDLVHVLRLLSTHHIFRETSPDTFALTRVGSLLDSGKSVKTIFSNPETKYDNTDGVAAFVALNTDEIFKSAAYLTEAFTGVQLPIPMSALDAVTTTVLPTTGYVVDDSAPCPSTTRSSSILTHIVYPEDENVQSLLPPTSSLERVRSHLLPSDSRRSSQSPVIGSQTPPSRLGPTEALTQAKGKCQHSGDTIKSERLPAFNFAFLTNRPYFEWLEDGGKDLLGGTGQGACISNPTDTGCTRSNAPPATSGNEPNGTPGKSYRLQRFSKAMMSTTGWEAPKAILSGFGWYSLPKGSTIIDVGGGIGSTTMILARALNGTRSDSIKREDGNHIEEPACSRSMGNPLNDRSLMPNDELTVEDNMNFRFIVQDRPVVTTLGVEAWRSKCPEMLDSGQVVFQEQDFFEPQPPLGPPHQSRHPAVYVLRAVLHDWPDECARRILINLRVASNTDTRLLIAEHVLPLACVDEDVDHMNGEVCEGSGTHEWTVGSVLAHVEGAERALVPPPLLSNLGKASASAYSMDLIMQMVLNAKERTLREFCALALSAGWRVTRMTRPEGSLFAYLVCEPIPLPDDAQAIHNAVVLSSELSGVVAVPADELKNYSCVEASLRTRPPALPLLPPAVLERSSSRCGTPTFGSRVMLPKDEELQSPRTRGAVVARKWLKSKGLGVRSVMMQKADKQREEQNSTKVGLAQGNSDVQNGASASPSHVRVWWKKSPQNSINNSQTVIHDPRGEVAVRQATGRGRRETLKSRDSPSTPSPRVSPVHPEWPSIESVALPPEVSPFVPHARRPSVASITRKLSFATFRRPSIVDINEPLPTPPLSATLTELAPPPTLDGDSRKTASLKHLPSLPTLSRSEVTSSTTTRRSAIPRHPSLNFVEHVPSSLPISKIAPPRRSEVADSPKSGILKSRSSPHTGKQSSSATGQSVDSVSTWTLIPRQRRMTLSNAPLRAQTPMPRAVPNGAPDPASHQAERVPSVPRLPRRLSIPMLRRKQSRSAMQDGENDG